jgi:hypothetical protein
MTEDNFWYGLEFRICPELSGMDDKVLTAMWCDGVRGDILRAEEGPAYLYGTIYIGKIGQTATEFRMALPDNITCKEDIVWSKLMPLSIDYSKRKLVMIDLSKAEPILV